MVPRNSTATTVTKNSTAISINKGCWYIGVCEPYSAAYLPTQEQSRDAIPSIQDMKPNMKQNTS